MATGIRLRTAGDDGILPLDEMLSSHQNDGDGIGDGVGADGSANFKPLPDKESAGSDDLLTNFVESEKLSPRYDDLSIGSTIAIDIIERSPDDNPPSNDDKKDTGQVADTPARTESGQGIEVSTPADTPAIIEVGTGNLIPIPENPRFLFELATDEILIGT
ncbi:MAG: hypothetical protein N5P05_004180 (plasmid) [Chroococcopsis gigantea SAG 12.99]|jgi:hypothetical protein|nr:hypothetical protein [Chroococcopsis gigantea SAG 12.99]